MEDTPIKLNGAAGWTRRILKRYRYSKTGLLLISALAAAGVLYFGVVNPLVLRFNRASLPDFPDCAGQPPWVVEYLKTAYDQAMDQPTSDEAVGEMGVAFQAHLFYDEAARSYKRAEELDPGEWRWTYYASLLYEEIGNTKAVIDVLKAVIEKQPTNSMAWFRLGNAYLKTQSLQEADRAFRQVLQLPEETSPIIEGMRVPARGAFPLKAYATMQLARSLSLQKRLVDAKALLTDVITANPAFGPAHRLLGSVYDDLGQEKEAAICTMRADDLGSYVPPADVLYNTLVLSSRNTDLIIKQITMATKWGDYEWCVTLVNHILQYNPNDGEALTFKIKIALDSHDVKELGPLVNAYAEQFKADEPKLLDMAKHLRLRGQYEPTVKLLKMVIALNPRAVEAHVEYVRLMKMFWQYEQGIQYCTEILATDPQNIQIRIELVDLLILAGRLDKAEEELKAEQRLHPDDETRSMMLGRMAKKKGNAGNAVPYFQRALAANPRNSAIQLELGECLLELRRWNDAARHWQKALQASPNNIDFAGQYALLLAACPDASVRDGKKALEISVRLKLAQKRTIDQDIQCATALAAAYAEMQQYDSALSVARSYLELSEKYGKSDFTERLQVFVTLFVSRKPYRL
jgi:tetratricopeptide (TPR) repeat protein